MTAKPRVKAALLSTRLYVEVLEGRALPSTLIGFPIVLEIEIAVSAQHGTPTRPVIELVPLGNPQSASGGTITTSGVHSGYSYGNGTGIGWAWATYSVEPATAGKTTPTTAHHSTKHHTPAHHKHKHHATSAVSGASSTSPVTAHSGEIKTPTKPQSGAEGGSVSVPLSLPKSKVPAPASKLPAATASGNGLPPGDWWVPAGVWVAG
jgi:hypothetical protein